jgi:hypothetical protein
MRQIAQNLPVGPGFRHTLGMAASRVETAVMNSGTVSAANSGV